MWDWGALFLEFIDPRMLQALTSYASRRASLDQPSLQPYSRRNRSPHVTVRTVTGRQHSRCPRAPLSRGSMIMGTTNELAVATAPEIWSSEPSR